MTEASPGPLYVARRSSEGPSHVPADKRPCTDCENNVWVEKYPQNPLVAQAQKMQGIIIVCIQCAAKRRGMTPDEFVKHVQDAAARHFARLERRSAG